jgi:hypothetical protein
MWVPSFSTQHPFAAGNVNVFPGATVFVTWQDATMQREPIDTTLDRFFKSVATVIARFDRFL